MIDLFLEDCDLLEFIESNLLLESTEQEFKYIKPIKDTNSIKEIEKLYGYSFPSSYKTFIKKNNGSRPKANGFKTKGGNETILNHFLSFNKDDPENMFGRVRIMTKEAPDLVPFATAPNGDLICFHKKSNNIILWDHETDRQDLITNSFDKFIKGLYLEEDN